MVGFKLLHSARKAFTSQSLTMPLILHHDIGWVYTTGIPFDKRRLLTLSQRGYLNPQPSISDALSGESLYQQATVRVMDISALISSIVMLLSQITIDTMWW